MGTIRSTEAVQGSTGWISPRSPKDYYDHAHARVLRYIGDSSTPVNITLALASSTHSRPSCQSDHTRLTNSIDNLFGGQYQACNPANSQRGESSNAFRGIGSQFVGSRSGEEK
ncbi:hypothetical protein F4819DRAFT_466595 [Hypoxylon fuscum]|nr:hypothetical protein F4819DRAFT_466595 [Hypoxylon fuscum]